MGVPPNGWLLVENTIEMDDLGVPLFQETSICIYIYMYTYYIYIYVYTYYIYTHHYIPCVCGFNFGNMRCISVCKSGACLLKNSGAFNTITRNPPHDCPHYLYTAHHLNTTVSCPCTTHVLFKRYHQRYRK